MTPARKRGSLETLFEEVDIEAGAVVGVKLSLVTASISDVVSKYLGSSQT
jgi:hypothetical protein